MQTLMRQRIKYLIEYGELYPLEEAASKNFVAKAAGVVILLDLATKLLMLTLS